VRSFAGDSRPARPARLHVGGGWPAGPRPAGRGGSCVRKTAGGGGAGRRLAVRSHPGLRTGQPRLGATRVVGFWTAVFCAGKPRPSSSRMTACRTRRFSPSVAELLGALPQRTEDWPDRRRHVSRRGWEMCPRVTIFSRYPHCWGWGYMAAGPGATLIFPCRRGGNVPP